MRKYNAIVIGGGFTGTAAAIAAAREGLSVLLIEGSGALGGAANISLVNPFMNFRVRAINEQGEVYRKSVNAGIFQEICENLEKMQGIEEKLPPVVTFDEEKLKVVLDRMCKEAGVQVLFHAVLCDAVCEDGVVQNIKVATKAGMIPLSAEYYIDCTGDADLAAMCGFPFRLGREEDQLCQPMTLCFRVAGVENAEAFLDEWHSKGSVNAKRVRELYQNARKEGRIKNPRESILIFPSLCKGVIHFNSTRVCMLNPTDPFDVSRAEAEAREQAHELFGFMKEVCPEFKNATLLQTAAQIGVRESRMIDGEYLLNENELVTYVEFPDSIAAGCYEIDIHSPTGSGTTMRKMEEGQYYHIPYRCLIPKSSKNLLVAGRSISTTHVAQSACRIMPIVCCMGEGAGVAASVAWKEKVWVKQCNVDEVHKILERNNCVY